MNKDKIRYSKDDLAHYVDDQKNTHFVIMCSDLGYDVLDESFKLIEKHNNPNKEMFDSYFQMLDMYDIIDGDTTHFLKIGLPELDVESRYSNFNLYCLQAKIEDYFNLSDFSMKDLKKFNKYFNDFRRIQDKLFEKYSNKAYLSALKFAKKYDKSHAKDSSDSNDLDL